MAQSTPATPKRPKGMKPLNPAVKGMIDAAFQMHKLGNLAQAEILYHQVLQHEPGNPFSFYGLGAIAVVRGEMEKAVPLLTKAMANGYHAEASYTHLGVALQTLGRLDEALEVYRMGRKLDPKNPRYPCNASVLLAQQGDPEAALKEVQKAIKLDPAFVPAYVNAGTFLQSLERYEEAAAMFDKVLQLDPNHAPARLSLDAMRRTIVARSL
jgi:tetratricopeptide (TPR) repeat protein